jgi:nuclear transport factor 2 (NTF2) superfamily protein
MPILDISFNRIEAERKEKIAIKHVKVALNVKDPKEFKTLDDKKVILFPFEFSIDYEDQAKVVIAGNVSFVEDKKRIDEIMKNLKKEREKERELMKALHNFVFARCSVKALYLEEQLGLPFHIALPRFK